MKFQYLFLTLCVIIFSGCSSSLDANYNSHVPPSTSSGGYNTPTYGTPKKAPATQKPYRIKGKQYRPIANANGFVQHGRASWYGKKFHGRKTSNGERYNMYAMTAAHKTLPMNTWVSVHNLENNRKIVVRINDRGPFVRGRIIDLSYSGAKRIGIVGPGTARVRITALGRAVSYSKKDHTPTKYKPIDYWKGNFTVQVGAFKIKANALSYRNRLSATYENAHITTYTDHRGTFYRVRIGRFRNLQKAIEYSENLILKGFDSALAVAE